MGTIELRTAAPERARALVQHALDRERRLLLDAAKRTRERVQELATRTGADLDVVRAGPYPHPEGQDMDLLELEGELEVLQTIEDELRILETLEICP